MSFENISKINVIGRPEITVPAGMPVETVLDTMNINIADYDQAIEGSTLVLSVAAGTKGLIDTRIVNGKLLPVGGTSFPTNADIENIAKLFPDDNLFETLNDPKRQTIRLKSFLHLLNLLKLNVFKKKTKKLSVKQSLHKFAKRIQLLVFNTFS